MTDKELEDLSSKIVNYCKVSGIIIIDEAQTIKVRKN